MKDPPVAAFLTTACGSWAVWGCQRFGAGAPIFPLQFVEASGRCLPQKCWPELPSLGGVLGTAALARVPESAGDHQGHKTPE